MIPVSLPHHEFDQQQLNAIARGDLSQQQPLNNRPMHLDIISEKQEEQDYSQMIYGPSKRMN